MIRTSYVNLCKPNKLYNVPQCTILSKNFYSGRILGTIFLRVYVIQVIHTKPKLKLMQTKLIHFGLHLFTFKFIWYTFDSVSEVKNMRLK